MIVLAHLSYKIYTNRAFSSNLGKGPWSKYAHSSFSSLVQSLLPRETLLRTYLEKMINLTSKLGEINDIEHNKHSKIYPQNQVILDCIMPSIPLMHKCLSIILIWVIVSHK